MRRSIRTYGDPPALPKVFGNAPDLSVRHPVTGLPPDYWFTAPTGEVEPRWRAVRLKRGDDPTKWWYSVTEVAARTGCDRTWVWKWMRRLAGQLGDRIQRGPGKKRPRVYLRGDAIPILMRGGVEAFRP